MNKKEEGVSPLFRIIDANLNRLKEGIRVCEDIQRYLFNEKNLSYRLKTLRHEAFLKDYDKLLLARDIANDPLKKSVKSELKRESLKDVAISNMKRAQESARVLEEILKLIDPNSSEKFKKIRYTLYDIEKEYFKDIDDEIW